MKVVGLITEYNPFHNGHVYHIRKAREITGADYVLVIMSGDFVQRGAPALMPKHLRAEMALKAGASAVLELPVCFAAGSAEYFAAGAIALAEKAGCVDAVCFGSECGDIGILERIAEVLIQEPEEYRACLQENLKSGRSFPQARQTALKSYFNGSLKGSLGDADLDAILGLPNNILGIEYIKALRSKKSAMAVHTIRRIGSGYHSETLPDGSCYGSASAIRRLISDVSGKTSRAYRTSLSSVQPLLDKQVPPFCIPVFHDAFGKRYPISGDDFSLLIKYRLMTETPDTLMRYMDVTEDLANRIKKHRDEFITLSQFLSLIKTRDITYTRISRCLFHILLNITKEDLLLYKRKGFCQYARILGFRTDGTPLLSLLKSCAGVPLITKLTRTDALSSTGLNMLRQDIFASDLYESVITDQFQTPFINEYQKQVVKIPGSHHEPLRSP